MSDLLVSKEFNVDALCARNPWILIEGVKCPKCGEPLMVQVTKIRAQDRGILLEVEQICDNWLCNYSSRAHEYRLEIKP